ncbi:MAG: lycopene cyclase, partial [Bacteroidia bacterium]|nr:lycopene cyclase [Bacteroidia bacterium]
MDTTIYDYVIVGAGAAGLHLALAFLDDAYFSEKQILILEKESKENNDKTWCFWEKGTGKWDGILHQSWNKSEFITQTKTTELDLGDYNYKMIRAIDFYTLAKSKLHAANNIHWVKAEVTAIEAGEPNHIETTEKSFKGTHVFDSMISSAFFNSKDEHIHLLQHFKGWVIETKKDVFNPDSFVMMDFRLKYPDSTCFTYVLPENKNKALVEFTFFSPEQVTEETYDEYLKKYIEEILQSGEYTILESEKGIIPMSNYPFHREHSDTITKIGTAGGWVKGSSGYSFKNAERNSK